MNELITLRNEHSSITCARETMLAMQKQASGFQHIRLNAKMHLVKVSAGGHIHLLVRFPARNEKCPCGSDDKWKRCCGAIRHYPDLPDSERDPGPPLEANVVVPPNAPRKKYSPLMTAALIASVFAVAEPKEDW